LEYKKLVLPNQSLLDFYTKLDRYLFYSLPSLYIIASILFWDSFRCDGGIGMKPKRIGSKTAQIDLDSSSLYYIHILYKIMPDMTVTPKT
jgi:hypothetical protein